MAKLNQVLAVEKATKGRVASELTDMHHALQKPSLLTGFAKTYQKKDEDGDDHPPERQKVQVVATDMLRRAGRLLIELLDVTASKDWANCQAKADVVVDGRVILEGAPATFLLFLEKQLTDLNTFVAKIPVLDPSEDWAFDESTSLYKTDPVQTTRTKKVQRPIVLYQATKEHPAQTQLITEDLSVGTWVTVKHSGALPAPHKDALLERIRRLAAAVKFARETANATEAPRKDVGQRLLDYLLDE
ncbi:MAG: hypothetical protein M9894_05875 [Planctomycetes bacterium]|nr:hypothetical protein [Planctomycetota bacterium]